MKNFLKEKNLDLWRSLPCQYNVRNQRSAVIEDVFSAGIWLASAPLHEAGKTTKSGDTLKPGIRREELGFASDTPSSDPNAYPLISTFSKPHSEVTSTTHIPALKSVQERCSAVFCFPHFFQASFRSHLSHPYPRAERKFRKGASLFSGFLKTEGPPDKCSV